MEVSTKDLMSKENLVNKVGPVGGSAISILGALLVMVAFLLPWASCSGQGISAWDMVTNSEIFGSNSIVLLCLVPFFALGIVVTSLVVIPATLVKKVPSILKPIGSVLLPLFVLMACCPSLVFFAKLQSVKNETYGMIALGGGYWLTIFGLFLALLGGVIALGTSGYSYWQQRKKPPMVEEAIESPPESEES